MGEKWELSKWWFWGIAMVVVAAIVIGIGMPISKRVEREVLVQSHQYKEGMADRAAVLSASLAEVERRIMAASDPNMKAGLEDQASVLRIQINSMRR
jgi:hypothetical protein